MVEPISQVSTHDDNNSASRWNYIWKRCETLWLCNRKEKTRKQRTIATNSVSSFSKGARFATDVFLTPNYCVCPPHLTPRLYLHHAFIAFIRGFCMHSDYLHAINAFDNIVDSEYRQNYPDHNVKVLHAHRKTARYWLLLSCVCFFFLLHCHMFSYLFQI